MKFKEITTKSEAELKKMLEEMKNEAYALKMKISLGESKTTHKLKSLKKDIARIMTKLSK